MGVGIKRRNNTRNKKREQTTYYYFTTIWIFLIDIMSIKSNQVQKVMYCMILFHEVQEQGESSGDENDRNFLRRITGKGAQGY